MASVFVEGLPIIQIRGGNVHITFVAPENVTICMSLSDFRIVSAKAHEALAKFNYDKLPRGKSVVIFDPKKKR